MPRSLMLSRRTGTAWRLALAGLVLAGCGKEEYERRLENTSVLYEHLNLLNANLEREWSDPDAGIRLRVPIGFNEIPAPSAVAPTAQGSRAAPPPVDERQPAFFSAPLPGLRGAFAAKVVALAANRSRVETTARMYILSSVRAGEKSPQSPEDLARYICRAAGITPPADETWRRGEQFPVRADSFVTTVRYDVVKPNDVIVVDGIETQLTVDVHRENENQVAIVWLIPRDIESNEKMPSKMDLSLETLTVSPISTSTTGPVGPSAPAGGF